MKKQFIKISTVVCVLSALSGATFARENVKIYLQNNKLRHLNSSVSNIKFGDDKNNGESISKIISYINANRSTLIEDSHGEKSISRLYFKPELLDRKDFTAKIFSQGGSASVRLYQSFYYVKDGERIYVPFEGAEINAYISNVDKGGEITSVNSSLINTKRYEHYISKLNTFGPHNFKTTSIENRIVFIDNLKSIDLDKLTTSLYPKEVIQDRNAFVKRAVLDESIVERFVKLNKAELKFVKDQRTNLYHLVFRLTAPYESNRIIDLNIEHENRLLVQGNHSLTNHVKVNIYTGNIFKLKKTLRRSGESEVWQNKKVKPNLFKQEDYDIALINLSKISEYFKNKFTWNGYDNKGSDLDATVRYKGSKLFGTNALRQNAAWAPAPYNQFLFGAGGDTLGDFLEAFDVIGHEYFHAVTSNTSGLLGGGETGALNEHISDIMGVGAEAEIENKPFDFKIGEKVLRESSQALRDFLSPNSSFSDQASHMRDVEATFGKNCYSSEENDECGVHFSNGVPNRAIALSIADFGWEKMKNIVFEVATKRLRSNSDFRDYKRQILIACSESQDFTDVMCSKIKEHFESVGIMDESNTDTQTLAGLGIVYDKELCEIITSTCRLIDSKDSSLQEMCKKCESN